MSKESLRDHFAGLAMQTNIENVERINYEDIAICAYKMTDPMLKEREKKEEQELNQIADSREGQERVGSVSFEEFKKRWEKKEDGGGDE